MRVGQGVHIQHHAESKVPCAQADPDVPPFMYGSHYSSAGAVLFYLIRLEPFSGLARTLQARPQTLALFWPGARPAGARTAPVRDALHASGWVSWVPSLLCGMARFGHANG